jgi:hypothetical protein
MLFGFLGTSAGRTVALVFALNGFVFGNWFSRIPAVKEKLELGEALLGMGLLGAPLGALAVMGLTGWLIAKAGAARVTMLASASLCLSLPLPALAPNVLALAGTLALLGAASAAMDVAMNAEAALLERASGRSIMVGFHAMFSFGGALGALTGALGAALAGPFEHLTIAALAGLAALAWRRGTLPRDELPGSAGPVFAFPSGALLPIALITCAAMLAEGAAADWSAVYLNEVLGTTPALAALGFGAFSAAMTLGRLVGDRLGDRLGEQRLVIRGSLLGGVALAFGLALATPPFAIFGLSCLGFGLAAIVPICFRRAASTRSAGVGSGAGHGIAAVATVGYAGFLVGPPVIGLVAEAIGLDLALGLVALLMGGIALGARRAFG